MAFGFPPHATGSQKFNLQQDEIASVTRNTLAVLGWKFEAVSPTHFKAERSMSIWSWGERIDIDVAQDGTIQVRSECTYPQIFDWGKNQRNVQEFFNRLSQTIGQ